MIKFTMCHFTCLATTGNIRGTWHDKLNQELGLKTLQSRQWFRKLCLFYNSLLTCLTIFPVLIEYLTRGMQLMF